jgi:hypothetical protein
VAAVSDVPADDFGEHALKARLEDLDRLEATARAHHGVVTALAARTAVLPLRLATVHRDEERLRLMLARRRCDLADQLSRLVGHAEWGVKVYAPSAAQAAANATAAATAAAAPQGPGTGSPGTGSPGTGSPGRDYLRRRLEQRRSRERGQEAAVRLAGRLREELAVLAADVRHHRPQSGRLAEGPGEYVANDAYLVAEERAVEFRERARSLAAAEPGVPVEVTGPWAPYSFAARAEDTAGAAAEPGTGRPAVEPAAESA